jgi:hypothetical protein
VAWCVPETARGRKTAGGHTTDGRIQTVLAGIFVPGAMHPRVGVSVREPVQVPCTFIAWMLIFCINRVGWRRGMVCPQDGWGTHHRRSYSGVPGGDFSFRCHAPAGCDAPAGRGFGSGTGSSAMHLYCLDVDFLHQPGWVAVWRGVSPRRPGDAPPEVVSGSIGLETSDFCRIKAALCSFCRSGRLVVASGVGWSARIL